MKYNISHFQPDLIPLNSKRLVKYDLWSRCVGGMGSDRFVLCWLLALVVSVGGGREQSVIGHRAPRGWGGRSVCRALCVPDAYLAAGVVLWSVAIIVWWFSVCVRAHVRECLYCMAEECVTRRMTQYFPVLPQCWRLSADRAPTQQEKVWGSIEFDFSILIALQSQSTSSEIKIRLYTQ